MWVCPEPSKHSSQQECTSWTQTREGAGHTGQHARPGSAVPSPRKKYGSNGTTSKERWEHFQDEFAKNEACVGLLSTAFLKAAWQKQSILKTTRPSFWLKQWFLQEIRFPQELPTEKQKTLKPKASRTNFTVLTTLQERLELRHGRAHDETRGTL